MSYLTKDEIERFRELVKDGMLKSISELELNALSSFGTSTKEEPTSLTLEDLNRAIDLVYPVLYYAEASFIPKRKLYLIKKSNINPEYILINSDDFQEIKKQIGNKRRLVNIRKYNVAHALFAEVIDIKYRGG
jgi:hypothetical protein